MQSAIYNNLMGQILTIQQRLFLRTEQVYAKIQGCLYVNPLVIVLKEMGYDLGFRYTTNNKKVMLDSKEQNQALTVAVTVKIFQNF